MRKSFDEYNEIACPHCKYVGNVDFESLEGIVTFWAEDGVDERECGACGKSFFINEHISRYWEVAKKMDMHYIHHAKNETSTVIGDIHTTPELLGKE